MKRLFMVVDSKGRPVTIIHKETGVESVLYLENKGQAKIVRFHYNGTTDGGNENLSTGYRIANGPDHD